MGNVKAQTPDYPTLKSRLFFLVFYGIGLYFVGACASTTWRPTGGGEWLWWMSGLALYVVSTLSAPFFVRPRDSLANALVSAPMLFTVDLSPVLQFRQELEIFRWATFWLVIAAGMFAVVSIALQSASKTDMSWRGRLSRLCYQLAVPLGSEVVAFTPPALISIFGFYQQHLVSMLWLAAVWVFVVTIKPVQLALQVWGTLRQSPGAKPMVEHVGEVERVDDPNLIRVSLTTAVSWKSEKLHTACLAGNRHVDVIPLFVQTQNDEVIGTGLCTDASARPSVDPGQVWTTSEDTRCDDVIQRLAGQNVAVDLIGIVVEDSNLSAVRIEVVNAKSLSEGTVVLVRDRDVTVYYQLLDAVTKEEVFAQNPRGTFVVVASQLGTIDPVRGFCKYGWVPPMNAPVFLQRAGTPLPVVAEKTADEFVLGRVAKTGMSVKCSLSDMLAFHTAVLGVTGTGKTELVLEIVRAHVAAQRKVFCVDFTGEYKARLLDCKPVILGFDQKAAETLEDLVNAIEYGQYKSEAEKKALDDWMNKARPDVDKKVAAFIESDGGGIGVFELPDIANTRATLRATELYLSAIFTWARENRKAREIVVVLEEAHTVIPETVMFGFDKGETQAVVGRMAQIALQGRKYGVGLLLVSQRTALVSKTLLSQCNTCICFTMYDKTGLDYLASVFASEHVRAIPNLHFLQGIAFGKAIKSERPIIFEIPEDPEKRKASASLNKTLPSSAPKAENADRSLVRTPDTVESPTERAGAPF